MSVMIAKWALDDYHSMIESGLLDGRSVELLNGDIVEMSPEGEAHAYLSHEAAKYLGRLLGQQADIRQGKPNPENIFWLIEFSDTSLSKDLEEKRKTYALATIQEYWVMNLRDQQLIVFRHPMHGDYQTKTCLTTGSLSPLAFPVMQISVQFLLQG